MSDVTDADRRKVAEVLWHGTVGGTEERVLAWVAEERAKARAETMDWVLDHISKGATFGRFEVSE